MKIQPSNVKAGPPAAESRRTLPPHRFPLIRRQAKDFPPRQEEAPARGGAGDIGYSTLKDSGEIPYNRPVQLPVIAPSGGRKAEPLSQPPKSEAPVPVPEEEQKEREVVFVGEAFSVYIIAQMGDSLYYIDKHAAHERILYNQLKNSHQSNAQMLLAPVTVTLSREEYAALLPELDTLNQAGFEVEDFGGTACWCALPMIVSSEDAASLIQEIAGGFATGRSEISANKIDWIYHSTACRAAVKAGDISKPAELQAIAEKVLLDGDIRTCPHGRPVCIEITKHELEKLFGRVK